MLPAALEATTERTLVFLGGGPVWLQVCVWLFAALVVGLTVYNHRKLLPMSRRVGMVALRAVLVLLLLGIFYQPAFLEENVAVNRNTVAVLVDSSESMTLPHGDSTRLELARNLLGELDERLDELRARHNLAFYSVGEALEDLPDLGDDDVSLEEHVVATSHKTHIVSALDELQKRFRNQDIGAVILITDGTDTSPDGRRVNLGLDTQSVLRDIDAPVTVFTSAGDTDIKDLAVGHVAYNNFAFLLNATSLEATIRVHGYAQGQIPVALLDNGVEVATRYIEVVPGQVDYPVKFEYVPKTLGKQVYGVKVEPLADEIYAKNNLKQVVVNVVRDKIRVVQIVGQPSWDQRYLRNHLKENPNVDLVSFFILVNPANPPPSRETALIPFPARELFVEELGGFDLLIFQNFNYGPFKTRQYLPNIARFVKDGGAFLMVGGPLSLSAGGYYGTPITELLPVSIPPAFNRDASTTNTEPFKPKLTESGRYHPITRLALDPGKNRGLWDDMEALEGVNLITEARSDAVVLLEHPDLRGKTGKPMPVASVREVDKGRSMVVNTDSTWHWAFKAGANGKDSHHYEAFWSNAIRWLIKDPELDLLKVKVLEEQVPVGDVAKVRVAAFKPDYRPAGNQRLDVVIRKRRPGGAVGDGTEIRRDVDLRTDANGELELEVPVSSAGIYEVVVSAKIVPGRVTKALDLFVGSDTNAEFRRVVGDARLVTNLARASDGVVLPLAGEIDEIPVKEPQVIRVKSRQHIELWNSVWVILLLATLFGFEWWLRRRHGYL